MTTLESLQAELQAISATRAEVRAELTRRLEEARKAIVAEFEPRMTELDNASWAKTAEIVNLKAATLTHPLEGKLFVTQEKQTSRSGGWYRTSEKTITRRAIVVCVRSYEDMPPLKRNGRYPTPSIGDVIMQYVNAKGEKLTDWEHIPAFCADGEIAKKWKEAA